MFLVTLYSRKQDFAAKVNIATGVEFRWRFKIRRNSLIGDAVRISGASPAFWIELNYSAVDWNVCSILQFMAADDKGTYQADCKIQKPLRFVTNGE